MAPRRRDARVAVVLAGGLGTRVAHLSGSATPKAMLPIDGHPFIDYKLFQLAALGFTKVLVLTGHAGCAIRAHIGDGRRYRLDVSCLDDGPELLGTGGAIVQALALLPARFWVTYGDSLAEADLARGERMLRGRVLGVMTVLENADRWEPGNVLVREGLVARYEKGAPPGTFRWIDHGLLLFKRRAWADRPEPAFDLGDVIRSLVSDSRLAALPVTERFHHIGTEAAWRETDAWARESQLWARLQPPPRPEGR